MSGIIITVPGVSLPEGSLKLNRRFRGFPKRGLQNLYLFEDADLVSPGSSGGLGTDATMYGDGTAAVLSGGGGLRLTGRKYCAAPAISFTSPWTLVTGARVDTATTSVAPAEAVAGILSFSQYFSQGAALLVRGAPTPWTTDTPLTVQQRPTVNGAQGTPINLTGSAAPTPVDGCLWTLAYDGAGWLSSAVYGAAGQMLVSGQQTIDPLAATTSAGGAIVTNLNPTIGSPAVAFSTGSISVEAFAVYNRLLGAVDVTSLATACGQLGVARGRPW